MNKIPEYQRRAILEYIENLENLIKWYNDQIEKTKEKIKEHEEFLGENQSSLLTAKKQ